MTVAELIDWLQFAPPEAQVTVSTDFGLRRPADPDIEDDGTVTL